MAKIFDIKPVAQLLGGQLVSRDEGTDPLRER